MRLVHAIDSLDPAHGGPSVVCASLAAAQASLGHTVSIVSYGTAGAEGPIRDMLRATPGAAGVEIIWIPRPTAGLSIALADQARRRLPAAIRGADFTILHGVWDRILLAAAAAARRASVPYAVIPHGMLRPWSLSQSRWKKRLALLLATRRMLDHAAFLHALNAEESAALARLRLHRPAAVIPNGVFLEQIDPPPPPGAFHALHPVLRSRPYILFLGRLHYTKGLEFLAGAFTRLAPDHPDLALVVAGPDGGRRSEFLGELSRAGLAERVYAPGPLYGRDKVAAYAGARCFCLPSRTEGFSVAILEALACGCPAVVSEHCHFPEVATRSAGAVVPLDPARIAGAIEPYLDIAARDAAGRAGRALVEEKYTWSRIAQLTIESCRQHAPTPP